MMQPRYGNLRIRLGLVASTGRDSPASADDVDPDSGRSTGGELGYDTDTGGGCRRVQGSQVSWRVTRQPILGATCTGRVSQGDGFQRCAAGLAGADTADTGPHDAGVPGHQGHLLR